MSQHNSLKTQLTTWTTKDTARQQKPVRNPKTTAEQAPMVALDENQLASVTGGAGNIGQTGGGDVFGAKK